MGKKKFFRLFGSKYFFKCVNANQANQVNDHNPS